MSMSSSGTDGETHPRTIIHIDIDYFYAQVEEIRNPALRPKPVGIQQKNFVVTCNYVARSFGVGKLMLVADAMKLCPALVLVNGEDLTVYKQTSARIFDVLQRFAPAVEKLGLDENYLDVSTVLQCRETAPTAVTGCIYADDAMAACSCGCHNRLILGSHLAAKIRATLHTELGLTSCAGVAHNKLLAKLIGAANKPNQQTTLFPMSAAVFLAELASVRSLTGIGTKTNALLEEIGIFTIADLQECSIDKLHKRFDYETAMKLSDMSFGRDNTPVRQSGKPKSIGLEDSCRPLSVRSDVEEKFRKLLVRLTSQVADDGRVPIAIKVVLRKYDPMKKTSHRETKQANIMPTMFRHAMDGRIQLVEGAHDSLLKTVMRLFERAIDMRRPFNITLLGLAFSKFRDRRSGSCSMANFLIKKSDIEVQSVISLSNEGGGRIESPIVIENDGIISDASLASCSDLSESEVEPSPKKTRIGLLIARRRCFNSDPHDLASPSKLRVADLRLNSKELERVEGTPSGSGSSSTTATSSTKSKIPIGVDPDVFEELPPEMQTELLASWCQPTVQSKSRPTTGGNTLHRYFITNK